jgi:hypothetical protein
MATMKSAIYHFLAVFIVGNAKPVRPVTLAFSNIYHIDIFDVSGLLKFRTKMEYKRRRSLHN